MRCYLLSALLLAVALLPGCVHSDQDQVASQTAFDIATQPHDQMAGSILKAPKAQVELPPVKAPPEILKLPPELPAWNAPPLVVPPFDSKTMTKEEYYKRIEGLYPKLPALEP